MVVLSIVLRNGCWALDSEHHDAGSCRGPIAKLSSCDLNRRNNVNPQMHPFIRRLVWPLALLAWLAASGGNRGTCGSKLHRIYRGPTNAWADATGAADSRRKVRSEEHTSELQS